MKGPGTKMRWRARIVFCLGLAGMALAACGRRHPVCEDDSLDVVRPDDWTVATHCKEAEPDYAEVFDASAVHVVDIGISSADHAASLADIETKLTSFSGTDLDALPKPEWYPATVKVEGKTWSKVAMRYKGHASLKGAFSSGVQKYSFILDFDHFADEDPDLLNQRFHGFSRLAFSSAYNDPSHLRDTLGNALFRAAGLYASRTAFAAVYLDWGEGKTYLGLYTVIEDAAASMLKAQFGDASGNLYKPWGEAARLGSLSSVSSDEAALAAHLSTYFEKSTNEGLEDYSDVVGFLEALHDERRTSDPAAWRARLEERFDVATWLKTLALNQTMENWDGYGCMHHNYYLYADPGRGGRLVYVPWDLNESLTAHESCATASSVTLGEVSDEWPLVSYLLADSTYRAEYCGDLQTVLDTAFVLDDLEGQMTAQYALVAPYVVGPEAEEVYPYRACLSCKQEDFEVSLMTGLNALVPHVRARRAAVEAALAAGCP